MTPIKQHPPGPAGLLGFTRREAEVVALLAQGLAAEGIAERLGITRGSAKWYLRQIFPKLGVHSHEDAVAHARQLHDPASTTDDASNPDASPAQLPRQPTPLIGRAQELVQLLDWLGSSGGLLTITGAAGCGKTRLALAVATEISRRPGFQVLWVDLAATTDPALVDSAIAAALDVQVGSGHPSVPALAESLNAAPTLLVLDNCEHLAAACTSVGVSLLAACPLLSVLATSRAALGGPDSHCLRLEPLPVPPPALTAAAAPADIAAVASVELFAERVRAADASFGLSSHNASAVARICRTLDGLPLALELAAARMKILTADQLAGRLEDALSLLTRNPPDSARRHATLRRALDWSFDLLPPAQQALLARLSVFSGGWELDDAEHICPGGVLSGGDVLDALSDLVDHSLVVIESRTDGSRRFRLLEVVRQYADEQLRISGERSRFRARHAEHFAAVARQAGQELNGRWERVWMQRLDRNLGNFREALAWGLASTGGAALGASVARSLAQFWQMRGEFKEGLGWHLRYLSRSHELSVGDTAELLDSSGFLAVHAGQVDQARRYWEQAIEKFTSVHDDAGVGRQLNYLAHITMEADPQEAAALAARGVELERAAGDDWWVSACLFAQGDAAFLQPNLEDAATCHQESLAIARRLGNQFAIARRCVRLSQLYRIRGDFGRSRRYLAESWATARAAGDDWGLTMALAAYGSLAAAAGNLDVSAMLLGATHARLENYGARLWTVDRKEYSHTSRMVRAHMGNEAFEDMARRGAASADHPEHLVAAVENAVTPSSLPGATDDGGRPLTRREAEVLGHLASGASNQDIAAAFGLSIRTVERHIANLYSKLGVSGPAARTAAAHFAFRHGLAIGLVPGGKKPLPKP